MPVQSNASDIIFDFNSSSNLTNWYVIDDRVMGGLSQGGLYINKEGKGVYHGDVTTANNGGFSSLRYRFNKRSAESFNGVKLHIKGDGKVYQFRIKSNRTQRYSYVCYFETTGSWETIVIPFSKFSPRYRGYPMHKSNYPGITIEEVGILIGNKVKESFQLEIETIRLVNLPEY